VAEVDREVDTIPVEEVVVVVGADGELEVVG
jgi:hypothetical protein